MVQNFGLNCPYARWQCFFFFLAPFFHLIFNIIFFSLLGTIRFSLYLSLKL